MSAAKGQVMSDTLSFEVQAGSEGFRSCLRHWRHARESITKIRIQLIGLDFINYLRIIYKKSGVIGNCYAIGPGVQWRWCARAAAESDDRDVDGQTYRLVWMQT
jgi:hypothetical protein